MLQSFIYFPGTSLWLFIHATYMALLYLFWKSIEIEHFKHDFFFFLLKVATGWHMLLVVVNILFGVKILTEFGEEEKLNYSLPQIGG